MLLVVREREKEDPEWGVQKIPSQVKVHTKKIIKFFNINFLLIIFLTNLLLD